jgi:hypothetical protein
VIVWDEDVEISSIQLFLSELSSTGLLALPPKINLDRLAKPGLLACISKIWSVSRFLPAQISIHH